MPHSDLNVASEANMTSNIRIDQDSIYDDDSLYSALGVSARTLSRARQKGQIRFSRKGKRILYLGQWVLEWIRTDGSSQEGASYAN